MSCTIFFKLNYIYNENVYFKVIGIKFMQFMLFLYISGYTNLIFYILYIILALFIIIYIWCIDRTLYIKHPYIFFIINLILIGSIGFCLFKICRIIFIKGGIGNNSTSSNNLGSNNQNPNPNGGPNNIVSKVIKRKPSRRRDSLRDRTLVEQAGFKWSEYKSPKWKSHAATIEQRNTRVHEFLDIRDTMINKSNLTPEDESFLIKLTEHLKLLTIRWAYNDLNPQR
jgi:hypothetical protein